MTEATKRKEKRGEEEQSKEKEQRQNKKEDTVKGGKADKEVGEKIVEGENGEPGLTASAEGEVTNGEKKEIQLQTSEAMRNNKNSDLTAKPTKDTKINLICTKTVLTKENKESRTKMNGNGSKMEEEGEERCHKESLSP